MMPDDNTKLRGESATNNSIKISDAHHAWIKEEAKRQKCTMRQFAEGLVMDELRRLGRSGEVCGE